MNETPNQSRENIIFYFFTSEQMKEETPDPEIGLYMIAILRFVLKFDDNHFGIEWFLLLEIQL